MENFGRKNFLAVLWDDTQPENISVPAYPHVRVFPYFSLKSGVLAYPGFSCLLRDFKRIGIQPKSYFTGRILTRQLEKLGLSANRQFNYISTSAITSLDLDYTSQLLLSGCLNGQLSLFKLDMDIADSLHLPPLNVDDFASCLQSNSSRLRTITPFISLRSNAIRANNILCVKWYPFDSGMFATSGMDCCLAVWEPSRLEVVASFQCKSAIFSIDFCRCQSKSMLVCGLEDSSIRFCDLRLGSFCQILLGHTDKVTSVCWNPVSAYEIASASSDQTVRIWDIRRGDNALFNCDYLKSDSEFQQKGIYPDASPLKDSSHGNKRNSILEGYSHLYNTKNKIPRLDIPDEFQSEEALWDYITRQQEKPKRIHGPHSTQRSLLPQKVRSAVVRSRQTIRKEKKCLTKFNQDLKPQKQKDLQPKTIFQKTMESFPLSDRSNQVFHESQKCLNISPIRGYAHDGVVTGILYTPDGRHIVSSGADRCIRLWNAETGRNCFVNYSDTKNEAATSTQFSLDSTGQFLFHGIKKDIKIFEVLTGKEIALITGGHTKLIRSLLWNSVRNELYSGGSDGWLRIWSAESV
ncbi:WD domain, G-beta repeat-containing protein [Cardiosporidium cionae]|uniref:WD domain, G-beta repeat-containing protein n=1 Tax=Cardiosporidium cionae TaxID=476202 RepID=A0ABQ7JCM3_9APIC|nr:WD domain, G-beta repeat-containing protein [Cardiosporidium cionae]|eukprot:KAF8821639.1 WD domain, G-beta repeat-containing protein [Cardiosporidium cionae]